MNTFEYDLGRGLEIEKHIHSLIAIKYPCATIINSHKGYDIWIPEIHKSVEVKYDPMSKQTNNYVVEIEFNGKDSALLTTTADYWVFYDGEKMCWITPKSLYSCILKNNLNWVQFVGKGDSKPKKAYLIKRETLFEYGEAA